MSFKTLQVYCLQFSFLCKSVLPLFLVDKTNDKNASFVRQIYLKTLFQNESINNHVYSEDMFKSTTII